MEQEYSIFNRWTSSRGGALPGGRLGALPGKWKAWDNQVDARSVGSCCVSAPSPLAEHGEGQEFYLNESQWIFREVTITLLSPARAWI